MKEGNVLVQCRFDLTDSEVAAAARKRGVIETEIAKLESAFNVQREKHKKALGTLEGQAGALADLIRKGYDLRDAECRIEFDYEKGEVCTIRVDIAEVVKTRPMTDGEKAKGPLLPLGPAIALDETDPDLQGPKDCGICGHLRVYHEPGGCIQPDCECKAFTTFLAAPPDEEAAGHADGLEAMREGEPEADVTACAHCGHPEGVHANTRKRGCMRADCQCKAYVHQAAKAARKRSYANPEDVCLCGDLRSDHHAGTGCDTCECTGFRDSDPLGVADVHPEPEKREAEL